MIPALPRRSFLAFLAALPGLRLLPAGAEGPAYVPSFLHPNDRWVVLRSDKGFGWTIMDLESGRLVKELDSSLQGSYCSGAGFYFDPSGRFLVMGYENVYGNALVRWELETGGQRAFSFERARQGTDGTFQGEVLNEYEFPGFLLPAPGGILRLPDSDWSLASFRLIRRRKEPLKGPFLRSPFGPLRAAALGQRTWEILGDPAERWAVLRNRPGPLRLRFSRALSIWRYGEGHGGDPVRVAARRTRDSVLVWSGYSTVREYEASSCELLRCVTASMPQTGLVGFGDDRHRVFAARPLGTAVAWNRKGRPTSLQGDLQPRLVRPPILEMGLPSREAATDPFAYSKDCRALAAGASRLALGFDQGGILLGGLNEAHGGPWVSLEGHEDAVRALAFAPDLPLLLSGARNGTLRLWDVEAQRLRMELPAHEARVNAACIVPGGVAATAGPDGIRLWELKDGRLARVISMAGVWVSDVALSPDGASVAGALMDGTVRLWDARDGAALWSAQAAKGWCAAVAFHPCEPWIATGHELGEVIIWDALTGQRLRQVTVEARTSWQSGTVPVHALAWSRDGLALAAAFGDAVRVYDRNLRSQGGPAWILPLDWADEYT